MWSEPWFHSSDIRGEDIELLHEAQIDPLFHSRREQSDLLRRPQEATVRPSAISTSLALPGIGVSATTVVARLMITPITGYALGEDSFRGSFVFHGFPFCPYWFIMRDSSEDRRHGWVTRRYARTH
jgi:hypothetical protein